MTTENDPQKRSLESDAAARESESSKDAPAWTDGLKQLYDSVVDEPLPDAFKDLLAQLDDSDAPSKSAQNGQSPSNGKTA